MLYKINKGKQGAGVGDPSLIYSDSNTKLLILVIGLLAFMDVKQHTLTVSQGWEWEMGEGEGVGIGGMRI